MLDKDKTQRIKLDQVLVHDWITQKGTDPLHMDDEDVEEEEDEGSYFPHVMVIDDSLTARNILGRKLRQAKCTCDLVTSADAGIALLKEKGVVNGPFDCILIDFLMPDKEGPEATMEIRSLGYTGKIVGISGLDLEESRDKFIESGADGVFEKPVQGSDVLALVEDEVIRKRQKAMRLFKFDVLDIEDAVVTLDTKAEVTTVESVESSGTTAVPTNTAVVSTTEGLKTIDVPVTKNVKFQSDDVVRDTPLKFPKE